MGSFLATLYTAHRVLSARKRRSAGRASPSDTAEANKNRRHGWTDGLRGPTAEKVCGRRPESPSTVATNELLMSLHVSWPDIITWPRTYYRCWPGRRRVDQDSPDAVTSVKSVSSVVESLKGTERYMRLLRWLYWTASCGCGLVSFFWNYVALAAENPLLNKLLFWF
jgi:hypothetical protein